MPAPRRAARRTVRRTARRTSRRTARRMDAADAAYSEPTYEEPPPAQPTDAPAEPDVVQRLQELDELHASGALTDEQFEQAKSRILDAQ